MSKIKTINQIDLSEEDVELLLDDEELLNEFFEDLELF